MSHSLLVKSGSSQISYYLVIYAMAEAVTGEEGEGQR